MLRFCRSFKLKLYSNAILNPPAADRMLQCKVYVNHSIASTQLEKTNIKLDKQHTHNISSLSQPEENAMKRAMLEQRMAEYSQHETKPAVQLSAFYNAQQQQQQQQQFEPANEEVFLEEFQSFNNDRNAHKRKATMEAKVSSMRYWDFHVNPSPLVSSSRNNQTFDFTVMSYNILAQQLLEDNSYLYSRCDDQILTWDYRFKNLLKEMISSNSDVICCQEMQQCDYENIFKQEFKALGYESLYKKRTGSKNDGCAIFYRESKFKLEWHQDVEFRQPGVRMLDRDNIGIIAILQPILASGRIRDQLDIPRVCVATTHLLFNPRRGDIKLAQLQILLAELDRYAFKRMCPSSNRPLYHPTILCGDMNSEPNSPLYNFITSGCLNYQGLQSGNISGQKEGANRGRQLTLNEIKLEPLGITDQCQFRTNPDRQSTKNSDEVFELQHAFKFQSAYAHQNENGANFITTQHAKANCTVDYIFFPQCAVDTDNLILLGTLKLLTSNQALLMGGLPNAVQSSDHISLLAQFRLKIS